MMYSVFLHSRSRGLFSISTITSSLFSHDLPEAIEVDIDVSSVQQNTFLLMQLPDVLFDIFLICPAFPSGMTGRIMEKHLLSKCHTSVTQLERLVKVFLVPYSWECSGLLAVCTIRLLVVILSTYATEWKHQLAFRGFEKQHRLVETSRWVLDSPEDNKIFSRNIRIFVYNDEVTQRISKCAVAIGIEVTSAYCT